MVHTNLHTRPEGQARAIPTPIAEYWMKSLGIQRPSFWPVKVNPEVAASDSNLISIAEKTKSSQQDLVSSDQNWHLQ